MHVIYTDTEIQISTRLERKSLTKSFCQEKTSWIYYYYYHRAAPDVAGNWKCFLLNDVKRQNIIENGWVKNSETVWVDDTFPDNIMEILVDEDFEKGIMELKLDPQDDSIAENIDD